MLLMSGGSEFHSLGAEQLKALCPIVLRGEGNSQVERRWGSEEAGGGLSDVEEIRQLWGGGFVDGFEGVQQKF